MRNTFRLLKLIVVGTLLSQTSFAQVAFSTIDTLKWEVDTLQKTLVITPKFELYNDTSIYFYEIVKKKKVRILTLNYVQSSNYFFGVFKGTERYPNSNSFVHLNHYSTRFDSRLFLSMVDTIIDSDGFKEYCIHMNKMGIKDMHLQQIFENCCQNGYEGLLTIAFQQKGETFPTKCLLEAVHIQNNNDPPYESFDWIAYIEIKK